MANTKDLGDETNEAIRAIVRRLVASVGSETKAAEMLHLSQGYVSEFLSKKRGAGGKILRALAALDAQEMVVALGATSANLPPGAAVSAPIEKTARGILRKRGWTDDEIDEAKTNVRLTRPSDAQSALTVANAWDAALQGPERLGPRPTPATPPQRPGARPRRPGRPAPAPSR